MIYKEEFRIGNYVLINQNDWALGVVQEIDLLKAEAFLVSAVNSKEGQWKDPAGNDLRPVVLDDQWFSKLGFVKSIYGEDRSTYVREEFVLKIDDNLEIKLYRENYDKNYRLYNPENYTGVNSNYWKKDIKVKYVHTIQNYYEDLTGKKLR